VLPTEKRGVINRSYRRSELLVVLKIKISLQADILVIAVGLAELRLIVQVVGVI